MSNIEAGIDSTLTLLNNKLKDGVTIRNYSIIEKHQGRIEIDSEVGKGTNFSTYIPREQRASTEEEK